MVRDHNASDLDRLLAGGSHQGQLPLQDAVNDFGDTIPKLGDQVAGPPSGNRPVRFAGAAEDQWIW